MRNLVIQTYIEDNIKRDTKNTYKRFPKLERLSRKCFERYAHLHGADYEFYTPVDGAAHWIRMEMFRRPGYDNVLYVDCDVLIHPRRFDDNIFDYDGTAVPVPLPGWNEFNMGVVKWTAAECEVMSQYIDQYFHPQKNQSALNRCYNDHIGEFKELPYKFNVTHVPSEDMVFRHYAGSHKAAANLKQCPIWKYYK